MSIKEFTLPVISGLFTAAMGTSVIGWIREHRSASAQGDVDEQTVEFKVDEFRLNAFARRLDAVERAHEIETNALNRTIENMSVEVDELRQRVVVVDLRYRSAINYIRRLRAALLTHPDNRNLPPVPTDLEMDVDF